MTYETCGLAPALEILAAAAAGESVTGAAGLGVAVLPSDTAVPGPCRSRSPTAARTG